MAYDVLEWLIVQTLAGINQKGCHHENLQCSNKTLGTGVCLLKRERAAACFALQPDRLLDRFLLGGFGGWCFPPPPRGTGCRDAWWV